MPMDVHRMLGPRPDKLLQQLLVALAPDQLMLVTWNDSNKQQQRIFKFFDVTVELLFRRIPDDICGPVTRRPSFWTSQYCFPGRLPLFSTTCKKWDGNMLLARSTKLPGRPPDILAPHIPANTGARCCKKEFWWETSQIYLSSRTIWTGNLTIMRDTGQHSQFFFKNDLNLTCRWSLIMWTRPDQTRPETSITRA